MSENTNNIGSRDQEWRKQLRDTKPAKVRIQIPRIHMTEENPETRRRNNVEVNKGLTKEQAMVEAQRCVDCPVPTCIKGCPVEINIPGFVKCIEKGDMMEAAQVIKLSSSLPAVCGRVCPQEKQCEEVCFYTKNLKKEAVAIGYLERFVADYEREHGSPAIPYVKPNGIKVAVVGSGPAGLSFAGDMAKLGYEVSVFEALHEIGGVLKYGIPEFRLPNAVIDYELEQLKKLGVKFETNVVVGRTITKEQLEDEGFKGIFVGSGAGLPKFMDIPGENLAGIYSSNEYLTRVNLMKAGSKGFDTPVAKPRNAAIIGGGNTALDAARTAMRQGAERVMIVYRRSLADMPAREEEIRHAKEEGIEFMCQTNPVKYIGNEKGQVKEMVVQKMELGAPDQSGRRSFAAIPGSEHTINVDVVVVSIGVSPNPLIPQSVSGLKVSKWGTIEVDENSMQTTIPTMFAGGDIVRGGSTVIMAMGDGKKAAKGMHEQLSK